MSNEDQNPKQSLKDRIKSRLPAVVIGTTTAVIVTVGFRHFLPGTISDVCLPKYVLQRLAEEGLATIEIDQQGIVLLPITEYERLNLGYFK